MVKYTADIGLATDGPQPIGAVDAKGEFVNPHYVYALILRHLVRRGWKGPVAKTFSTTQMMTCWKANTSFQYETPIGFKYTATFS